MTSLKNAVFINHKILFAQAGAPEGAKTVTPKEIANWARYVERNGKFKEKNELDKRLTKEDFRLELKKIAFEGKLRTTLEYNSREGEFEKKGEDKPIEEGEVSGALWDANGVIDIEDVISEIQLSGSNVVQSVFTVSREWAPVLKMTRKEDWQRVMRKTWNEFMSGWKVIPEGNQRWVAAYHVDASQSIHVHVLSWDSGKYGLQFTGEVYIPRDAIKSSTEILRREVFANLSLERSLVKDWARNALMVRASTILGLEVKEEALERVRQKGETIGESLSFAEFAGDKETLDRLIARIQEALPDDGIGRTAYARVNDEAKAAANLAVAELLRDPEMNRLVSRWQDALEMGADILGLNGKAREAYIEKERKDLNIRIASKVLDEAGKRNAPWQRSNELKLERLMAMRTITKAIPATLRKELITEARNGGELPEEKLTEALTSALNSFEGKRALHRFSSRVVRYAQRNREKVRGFQVERLRERAEADIKKAMVRSVRREIGYTILMQERLKTRGVIDRVNTRHIRTMLSKEQIQQLSNVIENIKEGLKLGEKREKLLGRAKPGADSLMETIEIKASISRVIAINSELLSDEQKKTYKKQVEADIRNELIKIARFERGEVTPDKEGPISSALEAALRFARGKSLSLDDLEGLEVRTRHQGLSKELRI